jgi:hypothetical protein
LELENVTSLSQIGPYFLLFISNFEIMDVSIPFIIPASDPMHTVGFYIPVPSPLDPPLLVVSSPRGGDRGSYQYKTTGKIFLYRIFIGVMESRRDKNNF